MLLLVLLVLVGVGEEGGRVKDEGVMEGRVQNTGITAANAVGCERIYFSCYSRRRRKRRRRRRRRQSRRKRRKRRRRKMLGWGRIFLGQVCVCTLLL